MAKLSGPGLLIGDDEISAKYGDKADTIIAALDADRATRREVVWQNLRYRPKVYEWLQANGYPVG